MRLEIQHLRTLAALRDTESLRHAAERISVTPSAVSHQLKDLEDLVGQRLFVRKTHPVRFTPAGARLLALADAVLPEVRRALVDVDSLSEGLVEHLFINVEHHGPTRWLLAALEAYHHAWPKVAVDVPIASTLDPLPALARGDLDVVFTTAPIEDPALVYEPLFAVEIQIAVAPDHPRAAQEWFSPADLATETLISYPVRRSRLNVFTDFLEPAAVEPAHLLATELPSLMVHLVAQGRGVCCLPRWVLDEHADDAQVALRPMGENGMWCNLYIAAKPDCRSLPHVAGFVRVAKDTASRMLPAVGDPRLVSRNGLICRGFLPNRDSQRVIVRPDEARAA